MQRFNRRFMRFALIGALVLALIGPSIGRRLQSRAADDSNPSAKSEKPEPRLKGSDIPPATFVVPTTGQPKDLLRFIHKINALDPIFDAEADAIKFLRTSRTALLNAADILLQSNPTEEQRVEALKAKLSAYQDLVVVGVPDILPKALKFTELLKRDKRPDLAEIGEAAWLDFRMSTVPSADPKTRRAIVDAVAVQLAKKPESFIEFARQLGQMLEMSDDGETAAAAYEIFGGILAKSQNENIRDVGESMRTGAVRRARLLTGGPLQVSGTTVGGKPFDIKQYKGKVVVVDFWATWCGPCVKEFPNLKSVYEKYHSRGLEVIGISLDDDPAALAKFLKENQLPWNVLFETDAKKKSFDNPNAKTYGISAIPAIFLVNREGKVVSLAARGERLGELVANLINGGAAAPDK